MESPGLLYPLLVAGAVAVVVAIAGAVLTDLGPWYRALRMPASKPPDWAFGPVWTTIFTLATVSAALAWRDAPPGARTTIVALFLINVVLNIAWSALFFKLQRPDWAAIEVVFLWASILALMVVLWPINQLASLLLLPYLVWVTIASTLTFTIVRLNA